MEKVDRKCWAPGTVEFRTLCAMILLLTGPMWAAEEMSSLSFQTTPFQFTSGTTLLETGETSSSSENFASVHTVGEATADDSSSDGVFVGQSGAAATLLSEEASNFNLSGTLAALGPRAKHRHIGLCYVGRIRPGRFDALVLVPLLTLVWLGARKRKQAFRFREIEGTFSAGS